MSATKQRRNDPLDARRGPQGAATEEERIEAMTLIDTMLNRGWTTTALGKALQYSGASAGIAKISNGRQGISKQRLQLLRDLVRDTEVPPLPVQPPADAKPMNGRRTIIDTIDEVNADLEEVAVKIERASEYAIPLLRPGMSQLASEIRQLKKWLRI